jgi:hypothetical protein
MPTSRIRQAAVGMLGAHLANSCANFKKQHEASGNPASQFRSLTGRGRWLAAQQSRARVVPAPSFLATPNVARSGCDRAAVAARCCRRGAGRAGRDGPAGFDVLMGDPIDIPKRILPTKLLPSVGECTHEN